MAHIRIHRDHQLGLAKARKIAWRWAEEVEKDFGMDCTVVEGDDEDVVEFKRAGVDGTLTVRADGFDLDTRLGLLLGAFAKTIEGQIEQRLDALLGGATSGAPAARKVAKKAAPGSKRA